MRVIHAASTAFTIEQLVFLVKAHAVRKLYFMYAGFRHPGNEESILAISQEKFFMYVHKNRFICTPHEKDTKYYKI